MRSGLGTVLLLTTPLFARERSDVIVLKNDDRLTCKIQSLAMGVLYVTHDDVDGTIRIQWSKVYQPGESSFVHYQNPRWIALYTGTLSTGRMPDSRSTRFRVRSAPDQEVDLAASQVIELTETLRNLWERFDGVFSFGMVYSKANRNTQYSLSSETEYTREQWGLGRGRP